MSSNEPQSPPPSRLSPAEKPEPTPKGGPAETPAPPKQPAGKAAGEKTADKASGKSGEKPAPKSSGSDTYDALAGSRTSSFWATVVFLVIVLVLLAIFVLQNTDPVEIRFLGWSGSAPLAAALMIAAAGGLLLAVAAGTLRILQLRRRVKRERKAQA